MLWKNKFIVLIVTILVAMPTHIGAAFYQAQTLAQYCGEYMKMIDLQESADQLEAGICSGYLASKIEVMDLSGQLCQRGEINLNDVAKDYVNYVNQNKETHKHTATYVLVDLLQRKYACENQS